ncbi:MAG: Mrp/NBP35 family ATP-binding protein [Acidobacteriota bacterium]
MGIFKKDEVINEQGVLEALKAVQDPDLHQDVVSLGFVKSIQINNGEVQFTLELTTPACPVKDELKRQAESAVSRLPGVRRVAVNMTSKVTSKMNLQARSLIPDVRNTIAVASGKGGVGKSTVAANLAIALRQSGASVGLMDADVYGPSIPILMGASEPPQVSENRIIPPIVHGVKMISMGYFLPKDKAVIWRGPMLHKMVQQFLGEVVWEDLDYLVIDLPPGTGDIQLSLCQTIPLTGAVIVSTPQDLALEVASKAIAMFQQLNTRILGVIENMSYYVCAHCGQRDDVFGHGGARRASEEKGFPFLGEIPLSTEIRKRSDQGQPVALDSGSSSSAGAFQALAGAVAAQVSIANHHSQQVVSIEP